MAIRYDGPLLNGRWRLGPRLGAGGQGRTFVAVDQKQLDEAGGETPVVVKQVKLAEGGWKKFDLFEREARVLGKLRHPGIPRVRDQFAGDDDGAFYLVMDKAPGATLAMIATRARFTERELCDVLARVLDILEYLHGLSPPVIHRDIKPANILRDADGKISLVDFGGVRDAIREAGGSTVVGTFGYMAPEQLHGAASPATDVYGLGATIVSLAGGVEPEHVPRKGLRMDLERHLAGLAPGLVALLARMTDPDPDLRPQSARALRAELATALAPVPKPAPVAAAPPAPETAAERDFMNPESDLAGLPRPIRFAARLLLLMVGVFGYVTLSVAHGVLVPLVFSLARAFTGKATDRRLHDRERDVRSALRDAKDNFRFLGQRTFRGVGPRRLPPRRNKP